MDYKKIKERLKTEVKNDEKFIFKKKKNNNWYIYNKRKILKERKKYTIIVIWGMILERQSRNMIKLVQNNLETVDPDLYDIHYYLHKLDHIYV